VLITDATRTVPAVTAAAVTGAGAIWYATRALRLTGTWTDVTIAGLLYAAAISSAIIARGRP
jgi:hypothetical protein